MSTQPIRSLRNSAPLNLGLAAFAGDIKIAHSIFALPFAAVAVVIARLPLPSAVDVLLLLMAMVSARTFAMGVNRWADHRYDVMNPRTSQRAIPAGRLSGSECLTYSIIAGLIFVVSAVSLSPLAGALAVPLLAFLGAYSWLKRWTVGVHFYLGACLAMAPVAVAIALTGTLQPEIALVAIGVCMWTAGFDLLYSLQDLEFDRKVGLRSIPARFGVAGSIYISRACFAVAIVALTAAGVVANCSWLYFLGVVVVAAILTAEQVIIARGRDRLDSQLINTAFFKINAWVGVIYLAFTIADVAMLVSA